MASIKQRSNPRVLYLNGCYLFSQIEGIDKSINRLAIISLFLSFYFLNQRAALVVWIDGNSLGGAAYRVFF